MVGARGRSTASVAETAAQRTAAAAAPVVSPYQALGVRPIINARGTFTIIGGNIELPEVQAVKTLANQQHAHMDELEAAAGKRLAELTGAEWGMVSAGCSAAISHATAACLAGGNPEMHVRLPNLTGFPKDEVIIPTASRNQYDAAVRALGVKIIEVDSPESLQLALGPRTAMIYIMAGPSNETGPMSTEAICAAAKARNVPVLVDAAAEVLTVNPNVHLQRGATLVCYSGGKAIRGPQSAGLLLGRKDLCQAAWVHSAPHHGYSRAMKIGREEVVGMVVAVESWVKRDHAAVFKEWIARLTLIADRVSKIPGVTATVRPEQESRDNKASNLSIRWDSQKLGITGTEVAQILDSTEPRIHVAGSTGVGGGGRTRRCDAERAGRHEPVDQPAHAVAGRRQNHRGSSVSDSLGSAHAEAGRSGGGACDGLVGCMASGDSIPREQDVARISTAAKRQSADRESSGGFRHARHHWHHQRRRGDALEQPRASRRFDQFPLHRQARR